MGTLGGKAVMFGGEQDANTFLETPGRSTARLGRS
jgi:hypothetical protein